MMIAQHRRRVDVVVHDQPQLTAGLDPHRLDVDAFVRQQTADARQRADFERALETAMKAARTQDAIYLPGWCGPAPEE